MKIEMLIKNCTSVVAMPQWILQILLFRQSFAGSQFCYQWSTGGFWWILWIWWCFYAVWR